MPRNGERLLERSSTAVFCPTDGTAFTRVVTFLGVVGLYLAGVAHWLIFFYSAPKSFAFQVMNFSAYQWPREYVFLSTLQEALVKRIIPYHIYYPMKDTTRFLGIPDYVTSPQVILLRFTDVATFVFVNTILLFTVSFVGCLLIRRRYRLSLFSFAAMTLLVNLNGNITAQIGAGQYVWAGFFLLPILCLLVLELVDGDRSLSLSVKLALLLFGMMMQGTYHFYTWSVMFLLVLGVFNRAYRRPLSISLGISALLVAYRVLPAAMTFWGAERGFISGYPTLTDLLASLVVVRGPEVATIGILHNLAWWEYDFFIGLLGLGLVIYFGIYLRIRERPDLAPFRYQPLDMPMLLMGLFSLSIFWAPIASLPLPLFSAERVSSRFLIVPLVMLIVLATLRLNHMLPEWTRKPIPKLVALFCLAQMGMELARHSIVWRPSVLEEALAHPLDLAKLNAAYNVVSLPDPLYKAVVNASFLITLLTLIGMLIWWGWVSLRRKEDSRG